MNKMNEMILVAPREKVFESEKLTFQGVNSDKKLLDLIVSNIDKHCTVLRRGDAEENADYKQPIPYAVLKRGNDVFIYERLKGGGEARLHNQLSLGVGGHMNHIDGHNFEESLYENLRRELDEELVISNSDFEVNIIGLINDDENEVGKVHIGLLAIIELDSNTDVRVRETEQLKGRWIQVSELMSDDVYKDLETWSQFVVDILN